MSRMYLAAGIGCVVFSAALLSAQEPSAAARDPADQEIQRLRGEVGELTTEVRRLETRLESIEYLLRELVHERRGNLAFGTSDTPLEEIRLAEPPTRSLPSHETPPPGVKSLSEPWRKQMPAEVDAWIRPPFRPGPRYHWNTFPTPPYPSGQ